MIFSREPGRHLYKTKLPKIPVTHNNHQTSLSPDPIKPAKE